MVAVPAVISDLQRRVTNELFTDAGASLIRLFLTVVGGNVSCRPSWGRESKYALHDELILIFQSPSVFGYLPLLYTKALLAF